MYIILILSYLIPILVINSILLYIGNSGDQRAMGHVQKYSFIPIINIISLFIIIIYTTNMILQRKRNGD